MNTDSDAPGQGDLNLILSFAERRPPGAGRRPGGRGAPQDGAGGGVEAPLIPAEELGEFAGAARARLAGAEKREVLRRALGFVAPLPGESVERSFVVLFSALEAALTSARGEDSFKIIPRDEFAPFERELKGWLRRHPAFAGDAARRALVYEKTRELNRLPFSRVFADFCGRHGVELSDLWPLVGPLGEWPLLEIRHRLVHGDPFASRPAEALRCAREHLRWTAERMLLALLGWPAERSNVSPARLAEISDAYRRWPAERARLA